MAITDRENKRVEQLIRDGLTTEQIYRRTGVHKRRVLRIRAKLKQPTT